MGPLVGALAGGGGTAAGAGAAAGAAGGSSLLPTLTAMGSLAGGGAGLASALRSQQQVPTNMPSASGVSFGNTPSPSQTLAPLTTPAQVPQSGGGSLLQLLQSIGGGH